MRTRADFYVRKDDQMKWVGSKGYDGYPDGIPGEIKAAKNESEFESLVTNFLKNESDGTLPDEGWPWPWEDSRTTDYSYIFESDGVLASCFGYALFDPNSPEPERLDGEKMNDYFPDMKNVQNVKFGGPASGLMVISIKR